MTRVAKHAIFGQSIVLQCNFGESFMCELSSKLVSTLHLSFTHATLVYAKISLDCRWD